MGEFLFAFERRIPRFYLAIRIIVATDISQKQVKLMGNG